jgi:hypothetical protein
MTNRNEYNLRRLVTYVLNDTTRVLGAQAVRKPLENRRVGIYISVHNVQDFSRRTILGRRVAERLLHVSDGI